MKDREKQFVTRHYVMTFGKHKGLSIETILRGDPGYIEWLVENDVLNIPEEIYDEAVENSWPDYKYGYDYPDEFSSMRFDEEPH